MINFKNTKREYLIASVFGILALILSILAGIASGNGFLLVLFRAFINMIIFSIVGFGCTIVIKKYVPEIYQLINSTSGKDIEIKTEDTGLKSDKKEKNMEIISPVPGIQTHDMSQEDKELESEFNKFDNHKVEDLFVDNKEKISPFIPKQFKDKKAEYEPKIAAQAIRTMLKRDE